jgi:cysteinyl-tRNA synthetase
MPADINKSIESDRSDILKIGEILGILFESPSDYFEKQRIKGLEQEAIDSTIIEKLINERNAARESKNWEAADRIRKQLSDMNIILEDRPDGTIWRIKS